MSCTREKTQKRRNRSRTRELARTYLIQKSLPSIAISLGTGIDNNQRDVKLVMIHVYVSLSRGGVRRRRGILTRDPGRRPPRPDVGEGWRGARTNEEPWRSNEHMYREGTPTAICKAGHCYALYSLVIMKLELRSRYPGGACATLTEKANTIRSKYIQYAVHKIQATTPQSPSSAFRPAAERTSASPRRKPPQSPRSWTRHISQFKLSLG